MKNKIRELTDRNKGISNKKREKEYQEYVRGWVQYYRLEDMKGLQKEQMNGKTENPSSLLETMEENKNKIPNAKSIGYGTLDGERTSM